MTELRGLLTDLVAIDSVNLDLAPGGALPVDFIRPLRQLPLPRPAGCEATDSQRVNIQSSIPTHYLLSS